MTATRDAGFPWKAHGGLLFVQFCFGFFPLFGKIALGGFAPGALAAWRLLGGGAILFALAAFFHGRALLPPRRLVPRMLLCGSLGIAFNQICFLEGLKRVPSINAALVLASIPVLTFFFAILLRYETVAYRRLAGVAVAAAGIAILVFEQDAKLGGDAFAGNLLLLGSASSYSLYLVLSRPVMRVLPPLVATAWVFALSAWTVPLVLRDGALLPGAKPAEWLALAWILAFPTVLAYLLNLFAMVRVPSSVIAFYVFLQPIITAAAGIAFLGERPTRGLLIAAPCVFAGMLLVLPRLRRRRPGQALRQGCGR